jgi:hypothetical protein
MFKRVFNDNNAAIVWMNNVLFGGAVCYFPAGLVEFFGVDKYLSRSVATPFLITEFWR